MSNKIYHKDGFSDYVDKLITKVEGYIPTFKKLSVSRKIIVILSKILQVANGLLIAKDAVQIKKNLKMLKYWGQKIKEEIKRNPGFIPSKDNSYYKNKDLFVQNAISVIIKLIGGVVLIGIEKGAMKQGIESNKATTHDSMPWLKKHNSRRKRHNDVPAFLQKAGSTIKEWILLQKSAASINETANILAKAAIKKDAITLKICIQKLKIELKKVDDFSNKTLMK